MSVLPANNLTYEEKINFLVNLYNNDIIKEVSIHICTKNLPNSFYNFSDFFLKRRIDNDNLKNILKTIIVNSLTDHKYCLAYVFNNTGLVICECEEDLENSVWKSNLDFQKL